MSWSYVGSESFCDGVSSRSIGICSRGSGLGGPDRVRQAQPRVWGGQGGTWSFRRGVANEPNSAAGVWCAKLRGLHCWLIVRCHLDVTARCACRCALQGLTGADDEPNTPSTVRIVDHAGLLAPSCCVCVFVCLYVRWCVWLRVSMHGTVCVLESHGECPCCCNRRCQR